MSMQRVLRVAIAVPLLLAGGALALADGSGSHRRREKFTAAEIVETARDIGRREGDAHPADISAASSTWGNAVPVVTFGRDKHAEEAALRVHVITMHGHFTMYTVSPPPGGHYPRNDWLTVVIEAKTGQIRETNLGHRRPPLERLGPVRHVASA